MKLSPISSKTYCSPVFKGTVVTKIANQIQMFDTDDVSKVYSTREEVGIFWHAHVYVKGATSFRLSISNAESNDRVAKFEQNLTKACLYAKQSDDFTAVVDYHEKTLKFFDHPLEITEIENLFE